MRATLIVAGLAGCKLFTGGDDRPVLPVCWNQPQSRTGVAWGQPAVARDLVVFGAGDGTATARDLHTGAVRWRTLVGTGDVRGGNLLARNGVVVVPVVRWTVALDLATGSERWRYTAPLDVKEDSVNPAPGGVPRARIDADNSHVFVPAWGASISAIELATGRVSWTWTPGDTVPFSSGAEGVRVAGDTVYATVWHYLTALGGRSEHWLVALDRRTGREFWRVVFPSYTGGVIFMGAPAVYRDLVIFHSVGGYEWAVNRFTREIVWRFTPTPTQATVSQTELYGDVVYHDGGDNHIYALRAVDGSLVWKAPIDASPHGFVVTERHLFIAAQGWFNVLDRATGRRIATVTQPGNSSGAFVSAPAYSNGRVFVAGRGAAICFHEPR
ncbi:MAG: outer membrane protein assembly factor BamB family protein [Gemmatimonadaceae bacterium]